MLELSGWEWEIFARFLPSRLRRIFGGEGTMGSRTEKKDEIVSKTTPDGSALGRSVDDGRTVLSGEGTEVRIGEEAEKIVQDMKFLTQFLNRASKGGDAVNIVVVGKIENIEAEAEQVIRMAKATMEENRKLRDEIRKLKQARLPGKILPLLFQMRPKRMENLERKILLECMEYFRSQKEAAKFLGWTKRVMNYRLGKFGLRAVDDEE
jgi:hypothetical protein